MPVATVNLLDKRRASLDQHSRLCANRGARPDHRRFASFTTDLRLRESVVYRKSEPDSQEGARTGALIVVEVRSLPLISDRVVKTTIPIDVGGSDPASHQRLVQRKLCCDVMKTTIWSAYEEVIVSLTAQVSASLKDGPATRIAEKLIVSHYYLVQFGPTIHIALHKAGSL